MPLISTNKNTTTGCRCKFNFTGTGNISQMFGIVETCLDPTDTKLTDNLKGRHTTYHASFDFTIEFMQQRGLPLMCDALCKDRNS